jgi:hypothetical protein
MLGAWSDHRRHELGKSALSFDAPSRSEHEGISHYDVCCQSAHRRADLPQVASNISRKQARGCDWRMQKASRLQKAHETQNRREG